MRFVFLKQQHKILIVSTLTHSHTHMNAFVQSHTHTAECIVDFWKSDKSNRAHTRRNQQKRIEKQINSGEDSGSNAKWKWLHVAGN